MKRIKIMKYEQSSSLLLNLEPYLKVFFKHTFIGGRATIVDFILLFIFFDLFAHHYLSSTVFSFTIVTLFTFFFLKKNYNRDQDS